MNWKKKSLVAIVVLFIGIQFIQPAHNKSEQVLPTNIVQMYTVPANVQNVLQNACYDCHTNNTDYPWYVNIQPVGWMMASHIKDGKANLNFSDFGAYSKRKQTNKFRAIATSIREGSMPVSSYTWMHPLAKLSDEKKRLLIDWATNTKDSLSASN
jgi:hypothetical protein